MEQLRKIFESLGLVGLVSHLLTLTRLLTGHWQGAKAAHSALANLRLDSAKQHLHLLEEVCRGVCAVAAGTVGGAGLLTLRSRAC